VITSGHYGEPVVLEQAGVAVAGGEEIASQGNGVLALFGGPQPVPLGQGGVLRDPAFNRRVVVGEIVFSQQVEDE
jgi:hypothetical protein